MRAKDTAAWDGTVGLKEGHGDLSPAGIIGWVAVGIGYGS